MLYRQYVDRQQILPELTQPFLMVSYPKAVNVQSREGQKGCKSLSFSSYRSLVTRYTPEN